MTSIFRDTRNTLDVSIWMLRGRRSTLETSMSILRGRGGALVVSCCVFLRIAVSGLRQVVTMCRLHGGHGILGHVMKMDTSIARNVDFEVADFGLH